jgi:hypothetical protein
MIAQEQIMTFEDVPDDRCLFLGMLDAENLGRMPHLLQYIPSTNPESVEKLYWIYVEIAQAIVKLIENEGPCTIDYALHHCTRGHFDTLPASHPVHTIIRDWLRKSIWDSLARPENKMSPDVLDARITANDLNMNDIEYPQNRLLGRAVQKKANEKRETIEAHGDALVRQLIGDIEGCAVTDAQKTIARIVGFWIYYSARKKLKNQRRDLAGTHADDYLPS